MKILKRVIVDILFVAAAFLMPWWAFSVLVLAGVLTIRFFVEGILIWMAYYFLIGFDLDLWFWAVLISLSVFLWLRDSIIDSYLRRS